MSAWDVRYTRQFAEQLADLPDSPLLRNRSNGEGEKTAKARARGLGVISKGQMPSD